MPGGTVEQPQNVISIIVFMLRFDGQWLPDWKIGFEFFTSDFSHGRASENLFG
jgi:hypothetical protein